LPPLLITRVLTDLHEYLPFRGDGRGVELASWYHRQFWKAAKEWLFHRQDGGSALLRSRHGQMADYFEGKWAHAHKVYSDKLKTQVQKVLPEERGCGVTQGKGAIGERGDEREREIERRMLY
jgi:hypothetical protein